jgi:outer membrane lipoprotein-sorting protein
LLGAANIRDDFEVRERKESAVRLTVDLVPKRKDAAMERMTLVCDDAGRITALTIYDRSGNMLSIQFSNVAENTGLGDARFRFNVPKGTEIIEQ